MVYFASDIRDTLEPITDNQGINNPFVVVIVLFDSAIGNDGWSDIQVIWNHSCNNAVINGIVISFIADRIMVAAVFCSKGKQIYCSKSGDYFNRIGVTLLNHLINLGSIFNDSIGKKKDGCPFLSVHSEIC